MEDGGLVAGGVQLAGGGGGVEGEEGVDPVGGGDQQQQRSERGPRRFVRQAGHDLVGEHVEPLHRLRAQDLFGGDVQAVGVAEGRVPQPNGGVREVAEGGGGGGGGVVAGEDLLQHLGRGFRGDELRSG